MKSRTFPLMTIAVALAISTSPIANATVLSDNLSEIVGGTEPLTPTNPTRWVTSSFGTDASSYSLSSITIRIQDNIAETGAASTPELDVYSDNLGAPGSPIGSLSSPGSIGPSLADITFTASGINLAANTTYWTVFKALDGSFNWAWTASDAGSGVGFQHTWGYSEDSGATWNTFQTEPQLMAVEATPTSSVPEPATLALLAAGLAGLGFGRRRRAR